MEEITWKKKYDFAFVNQKIIRVMNYPEMNSVEEDDLPIRTEMSTLEMFEACRTLTPSGLKLYLYLMSKENHSEFPLSAKEVIKTMKISEDSYHRAVNELIENDYLKEADGYWYFLPRPGIENF